MPCSHLPAPCDPSLGCLLCCRKTRAAAPCIAQCTSATAQCPMPICPVRCVHSEVFCRSGAPTRVLVAHSVTHSVRMPDRALRRLNTLEAAVSNRPATTHRPSAPPQLAPLGRTPERRTSRPVPLCTAPASACTA